jgi:hypothetical protein
MPLPQTFTYDITTPTAIGLVRLRINDKYAENIIFYDEEIAAALVLEDNNIKRASAFCLETIAADEVLVQKVIKTLQLTTDGAKVAAELRANAKLLRDQADREAATPEEDATFDIAEWNVNPFSVGEILFNAYERLY